MSTRQPGPRQQTRPYIQRLRLIAVLCSVVLVLPTAQGQYVRTPGAKRLHEEPDRRAADVCDLGLVADESLANLCTGSDVDKHGDMGYQLR